MGRSTAEALVWTGQCWEDSRLCHTCWQPECQFSTGGSRPLPGSIPSRLKPGEREDRGYGDVAIHPDEAIFVLHRGWVTINGEYAYVYFIQNEAFVTMIGFRPEEAVGYQPESAT
jgi:hypothetical protein